MSATPAHPAAVLDLGVRTSALLSETRLLAELVHDSDERLPVPTCPGWTLANLATHVGRGHRWAAAMVAGRARAELAWTEVPGGRRPKDRDEAAAWLRESATLLVDAAERVGADATIWSHVGPGVPAAWWVWRRLHESTVHRADALLALGHAVNLSPELAADGICELLGFLELSLSDAPPPLPEHTALLLDANGTWRWAIRPAARGFTWNHERPGDATTIRGDVVQLFLLLVRRISVEHADIEVAGDTRPLSAWLDNTPY